MKKRSFTKTLSLSKVTVSNLSLEEMRKSRGGKTDIGASCDTGLPCCNTTPPNCGTAATCLP
ncbi:class I lanthipeptide [Acidobacteriota bacterium]